MVYWNIVKAIFFLFVGTYGLLFFTGHLKCSEEKEKIRKETVKKYKWFLIVCIMLVFIGGISMFIDSVIKMLK
jgi:uncharacterized membrane protein SpoIIM required for sporulation